ncbi:MAG TPA: DUF5993 family protein [Coxiellaceae bacterium]|nr:DUF5993 family protein [Coxiellaceae bacterium]
MALLFIVLLITVLFAWKGKRQSALCCFGFSLLLGIIFFVHHITEHLKLDL